MSSDLQVIIRVRLLVDIFPVFHPNIIGKSQMDEIKKKLEELNSRLDKMESEIQEIKEKKKKEK